MRALGVALALLLAAPAAASADQTVYAGFPSVFLTPDVTIAQGEALSFTNFDVTGHDVTATQKAGGKPIFASPLTAAGATEAVVGAQALVPGSYAFICSIHPGMTGTLTVAGAAAPQQQPPPSGGGGGEAKDAKAPAAGVKVLDRKLAAVRKRRALLVSVTTDEDASVSLTAKSGKTTIALASSRATAGTSKVMMKLTKAGAKLVKRSSSLSVAVSVRAGDAAGNTASASAKKKLA